MRRPTVDEVPVPDAPAVRVVPVVDPRQRTETARAPGRRATPAQRPPARTAPTAFPSLSALRLVLVSIAVVGALVVAVVAIQALISQNSFRLEELSKRARELQEEHVSLQLEVARLSSPDRIVEQAERLGLRRPDPEEVETLYVRLPR